MILKFDLIRSALTAPLAVALAFAMSGCGRGDTVYGGGATALVKQGDLLPVVIERSILPRGFYNQSVNRATVDIYRNSSNYPYLRLKISSGDSDVGGFNGAGVGNRALVGLSQFDATLLSSFPGVTFDAKSDGLLADVLLVVDLDCTGGAPALLKASGDELFPAAMALEGGFKRFEASTTAPVWTSNMDITDPGDPSVTLLSTSSAASLDDVIAAYPNACIKNTASFDPEMPKSLPTAGLLLSLGSADTTFESSVLIDRIEIGIDVFNDWETQQ